MTCRNAILIHKGNRTFIITGKQPPLTVAYTAIERKSTMGQIAQDRQQKHHEILDAYELLYRSVDNLEGLTKRILHGDAPKTEEVPQEDYKAVTLGQFLEAFPLQLRELSNRVDVARSDIAQALF